MSPFYMGSWYNGSTRMRSMSLLISRRDGGSTPSLPVCRLIYPAGIFFYFRQILAGGNEHGHSKWKRKEELQLSKGEG